MIKWLFKYGTVIFLFNTVLLSIESTFVLGNQIFLVLMVMYSFVLLINPRQISKIIFHKAFLFFLILNIINLSYFLLFHSLSDSEAAKYLLARGMQFSIISFSIYYNFEYYKDKFLEHLVYIIFGIIVFSLVANPYIFSGRYSGIMWNPNAFSSFTCMGFAALFLMKKKRKRFELALLLLFLLISLASGSRDVLVAIALAFLFKYGFSNRNIIYAFLALSAYYLIITIKLDTSLNRFAEQSLFNDRFLQYQYAFLSFLEKPFFGFGLDKYAYINPEIIPDSLRGYIISAHNGYLAILVQYGSVFGFLVLGIIFRKSFLFFSKRYLRNPETKFYVYTIVYTLVASMYETFMTGINEFQTILFWLALSLLSFTEFKRKYGDGD